MSGYRVSYRAAPSVPRRQTATNGLFYRFPLSSYWRVSFVSPWSSRHLTRSSSPPAPLILVRPTRSVTPLTCHMPIMPCPVLSAIRQLTYLRIPSTDTAATHCSGLRRNCTSATNRDTAATRIAETIGSVSGTGAPIASLSSAESSPTGENRFAGVQIPAMLTKK